MSWSLALGGIFTQENQKSLRKICKMSRTLDLVYLNKYKYDRVVDCIAKDG